MLIMYIMLIVIWKIANNANIYWPRLQQHKQLIIQLKYNSFSSV